MDGVSYVNPYVWGEISRNSPQPKLQIDASVSAEFTSPPEDVVHDFAQLLVALGCIKHNPQDADAYATIAQYPPHMVHDGIHFIDQLYKQ